MEALICDIASNPYLCMSRNSSSHKLELPSYRQSPSANNTKLDCSDILNKQIDHTTHAGSLVGISWNEGCLIDRKDNLRRNSYRKVCSVEDAPSQKVACTVLLIRRMTSLATIPRYLPILAAGSTWRFKWSSTVSRSALADQERVSASFIGASAAQTCRSSSFATCVHTR